ncbi:uncharacterized protein LOC111335458 [Stylophora pistillata]|uniref:ShKT domain-containing protein n=1 Tax=Stylophora pistillata TaxID=50429 RepID=A0A2B4RZ64_STYPI|nr:uncharacterized protein LOC111335458 [Stylophora pistillata]PFX21532.1 hypothetical protein AWC38_SpisGene13973 [Stylophora pistillata]
MITTALGKLCLVAVIVEVLLGGNLVHGSSIYVGRHDAGAYWEEGPPGSISSVVCKDQDQERCNLLTQNGKEVCSTTDESLKFMLESNCQATCGFCDKENCEDFMEKEFCEDYKSSCFGQEAEKLVQDICPKTCRVCPQAPSKSKEDNNWVFLHP